MGNGTQTPFGALSYPDKQKVNRMLEFADVSDVAVGVQTTTTLEDGSVLTLVKDADRPHR